jgi:hypothetical protein
MDTRSVEVELGDGQEGLDWQAFRARLVETGEVFEGWWCRQGDHLLTLCASPAPGVPNRLNRANF